MEKVDVNGGHREGGKVKGKRAGNRQKKRIPGCDSMESVDRKKSNTPSQPERKV
jgi:hypothetical protein